MAFNNQDETNDFDDELAEGAADEGSVDVDDDSDAPTTAISHAFRQATAAEAIEEQEEDDSQATAAETIEEQEEEDEEAEEAVDEGDDPEATADKQRIVEAIDALSDDEEEEIVPPPLTLPSSEVERFQPQEHSNHAYADAVRAYYEEKDYQRAIEKFEEAIKTEAERTEADVTISNEILAKAMYWQGEAYIKMQNIPQAVGIFENLIETCGGHYLSLAARRRADQFDPKSSQP